MIIKGARIFDSQRLEFYDDKELWIEEEKVLEIKDRFNHAGQEVMDLTGHYLLPGWIDAHVHLTLSGETDPLGKWQKDGSLLSTIKAAVKYLPNHLKAGVTVIRDLGGDGEVTLELKKALKLGLIQGPDLYTSGKAITMTGGHIHQISREVDGPIEARKAAREELKKGVDLLKVIATGGILTPGVEPGSSQLTEDEIRAVVEEGHKAGRRIAAHVEGTAGIITALRAGVDTLEHGIGLNREGIKLLLKNSSAVLIPTLAAPKLILKYQDELPEEMVRKAQEMVEIHQKSFALAYQAGCVLAVGTDAGTPFNTHGQYQTELAELLEAGMKVEEVLQAASLNGARALGLAEKIGNIAAGMIANMTIIAGELNEKNWYQNVKLVIQRGKLIEIS